jgi:ATP/ADP translocase
MLCAERAYSISAAHGFNPADEEKRKKANAKKGDKKAIVAAASKEHAGMFQMARALFQRVPVLGALFCEILACQGLSTLLNVCFVTKLSSSMPDDQERAGWMGRFYATTNVVSSAIQFFVLPPLMARVEPSVVWKAMPMVMVVLMASQCLEKNPSLHLVAGSLMAMKVMEFSARRMLDEMVYVPLDFESRYVGKEVIGVFGFRFGKSGMSLALSGLSSIFGNFGLQQLSYMTTGASLAWLSLAWRLSTYVPTGVEAEATYKKTHT